MKFVTNASWRDLPRAATVELPGPVLGMPRTRLASPNQEKFAVALAC